MSEMKRPKSKDFMGFLFVAFMFLGLGIGILIDEVAPALFVGMGLGFLSMAILDAIIKEPVEEGSNYESYRILFGERRIHRDHHTGLARFRFHLRGLSILTGFEVEWRIFGGVLIILLGIWFIMSAMRAIVSSRPR